jgi:hypothetical protein
MALFELKTSLCQNVAILVVDPRIDRTERI